MTRRPGQRTSTPVRREGAAAVWWAAPLAVVAATADGAVARAGIWRAAIEVPGLGSLNKGGAAPRGPTLHG